MRYNIILAGLDYVNENAKVVIVGKTPGRNQMNTTVEGLSSTEVKKTRAFAGKTIRNNLVNMLDHIGINKYLGIDSCKTLWEDDYEQNADFTSILKNCVMDTRGSRYRYISSIPLPMKKYPEIYDEFNNGFANDCLKYSVAKIWVALGSDVEIILKSLQESGRISSSSIILSIPHPSGANAGRVAAFLGTNNRQGTAENSARKKAAKCMEQMNGICQGS